MWKTGLVSVKHQDVKEASSLQASFLRAPPETCVLWVGGSLRQLSHPPAVGHQGGEMCGRKHTRWPVSVSGFHSCPKVGGIKSGVSPAHCSYCSTGVPLGPGGKPWCFLRRWRVEKNPFWQDGYVTSVVSLGISTVSVSGGGVGVGWLHFAFVRHTHSCLCWPRIFAMYPQNPRPTKVQKHVEQSTHLELCSVNGHKSVSGAGSTCGHLARGSNAGGPAPRIAWLAGAPGDSKEVESSLSCSPDRQARRIQLRKLEFSDCELWSRAAGVGIVWQGPKWLAVKWMALQSPNRAETIDWLKNVGFLPVVLWQQVYFPPHFIFKN